MNRRLIRMALKREKGRNIFPCGSQTILKTCIIYESALDMVSLSYNIREDNSTRMVIIKGV